MQKTSTLKPVARGDIFLGNTYLDNPEDDHMGEGRVLQLDAHFVMKGTWYTTGTRYFIVGCKNDRRWFIAPAYLADGRLLCTDATGLAVYDEEGRMRQHIALPGYGWAQVTPDVDERYALAANVWTGVAARIDLKDERILQQMDTGFTAPFRSLAGIAVFRG